MKPNLKTVSDWEQIKIHEIISDDRKIGIILDLYPDKRWTVDELKEQTNLSKDSLNRQLRCLKEVNLVEKNDSTAVYFLTSLGRDLVKTYGKEGEVK